MKTTEYKSTRFQTITAAVAELLDCAKAAHGVGEQAAEDFRVLAADLRHGVKKLDEVMANVAYIIRQGDVVMADDVGQLLSDLQHFCRVPSLPDTPEHGETPFGGRYWGMMLFFGWSMVVAEFGANSKVFLRVLDWVPVHGHIPKAYPNKAHLDFLARYGFKGSGGKFEAVWPIEQTVLAEVITLIRTKKADPECEANRAKALELLNANWRDK